LIVGIFLNLFLLGYFKYSSFLAANLLQLFGTQYQVVATAIPLALSFHTFQQIAFLIDCRNERSRPEGFGRYLFFVFFFPQLISGPIIHYRDFSNQFSTIGFLKFNNVSAGLTLFALGLFKKLIFADNIQPVSDHLFNSIYHDGQPGLIDAWVGAISYSCQIYFDFSAYSDMALGLAKIFGFRLPINFNSPYKSQNVAEFWRRWHITLSTFLRDYLYLPLGGNRVTSERKYINLLAVMLLGGLWHGAAWTFILWGFYHGLLLVIYHIYKNYLSNRFVYKNLSYRFFSIAITFILTTIGWILFRAPDLETAMGVYTAMLGFNGLLGDRIMATGSLIFLTCLLFIIFIAPNTMEIMSRYRVSLVPLVKNQISFFEFLIGSYIRWRPTLVSAIILSIIFVLDLSYLGGSNQFLYFQF
jgi:D-alanyl-lipoteichoic acid acyltransferase DltB (MBOAT superfamily)